MMVFPWRLQIDHRHALQTDGIKWCLAPLGLRGNSHQRNNDDKLKEVAGRRNIDFS